MPITLTSGATKVPVYNSPLFAVCGGKLYYAYPYGPLTVCGNQSTAPLLSTVLTSMCFLNETIYAVDGNAVATVPLSTLAYTPYTPSEWVSGHAYATGDVVIHLGNWFVAIAPVTSTTAPGSDTAHWDIANPPTDCFLCANWRGRLVLAGDKNNPQNFYMSRVGSPLDWNYAATDPAAAVAGNLSESGQIGEPIVALIPYTDDYMLIGCTNSLWMLQGDPANGGSIVRVSDQMGLVSPNAWCIDPAGTLYFIARGGLYSVRPIWEFYQPPQLLSGETYDQYFQSLINGSYYISMQWDVDAKYLHIFATPTEQVDGDWVSGTHLIFDQRNGGLWPQQYQANQGPTATCRYAANNIVQNTAVLGGAQRAILLGGQDGYIRQWTSTNLTDDGSAITSWAYLGPVKPGPEASILSGITIDFGETLAADSATEWYVEANLQAGPDAYSVTEGISAGDPSSPHNSFQVPSTLDRRQKTYRQRMRGGWFSIQLFSPGFYINASSATVYSYWTFESAFLEFLQAGRNREIR